MAWTTPRTWVTSEVVTSAIMNTHVRDNLIALRAGDLLTALRGSPVNGDRIQLTDNLTTPTWVWHLKYISAATTYKWYFIGGCPGFAEVTTSQGMGVGGYSALGTAGPSFTLPLGGDYYITQGATFTWANGGGSNYPCNMSYDIGGTGAVDADSITFQSGGGNTGHSGASRTRLKTGLTAVALVSKYKVGGGSLGVGTWQDRYMSVIPFRVA